MRKDEIGPRDEADERARLLARCLGDFRLFCGALVWIAPKEGPRCNLRWNSIQGRYSAARSARDIALKGRQCGFSTLEIARDVWRFLQPGQRVSVVVQSMADDAMLKDFSGKFQRIFAGLQQAGLHIPFGVESATQWTIPSRDSSLQLVPAGASEKAAQKKGRGGTVTRVHATEVAFWEHPELTLNALLESVPTVGETEVIFESTPNGAGNYFHSAFLDATAGRSGYRPHFFTWYDDDTCTMPVLPGEVIEPRTDREHQLVELRGITPEQLKWYQHKLIDKRGNQDLLDQEYPSDPVSCFLQSGRNYFDIGAIAALSGRIRPPVEVRDAGLTRIWEHPEPGARYVAVTDPAEGLGPDGDWSVTTFWHVRRRTHVATVRTKLREGPHARLLQPLCAAYNNAVNVVERNKGMALIAALENLREPRVRVYYDEDEKPGIVTTPVNRPVMLETLAEAIRLGELRSNDEVLLSEARTIVIDPRTGKPHSPTKGKKGGASDDAVLSAAIALFVMNSGITVSVVGPTVLGPDGAAVPVGPRPPQVSPLDELTALWAGNASAGR